MNLVVLIGRLTQDPTCQYTQNGTAYTRNTIAVQRAYKNANGEYDTDFINFVAYKQTAELIVKHFVKGNKIGVQGSIQIDKYQDQQGQTRYSTSVQVEKIMFLEPKQEQKENTMFQPTTDEFEVSEDDLPF